MHLFCHFHRLLCPNESAAFFRCLNAFQAESSKLQSNFCSDDSLGTCSAVLSNHTLTFHSGQFNFLRSIGGIGLIHIPKAPVQKPVTIGIHIGIGVSLFIAAESSHFHAAIDVESGYFFGKMQLKSTARMVIAPPALVRVLINCFPCDTYVCS